MSDVSDFDAELDACWLSCPLPILKAKKALSSLSSGQILKVLATDPHATRDFEAFCSQTGHQLAAAELDSASGIQTLHIRKR